MKTSDVLDYYVELKGSQWKARQELAEVLNIHTSASYQWGEWVPERTALRLQSLTHGALRIDLGAPYAMHYMMVPGK